jgi:hypothetical protein
LREKEGNGADVTRLIEDLGLKDSRVIPTPVMGGITDLHTEGLHYLNGFFTITPALLNMLKINTDVRCFALTYRQEAMKGKPQRVAETPPKFTCRRV